MGHLSMIDEGEVHHGTLVALGRRRESLSNVCRGLRPTCISKEMYELIQSPSLKIMIVSVLGSYIHCCFRSCNGTLGKSEQMDILNHTQYVSLTLNPFGLFLSQSRK